MLDTSIYDAVFEALRNYEWENKNLHYLERYIRFISTRKNIKIPHGSEVHHILPVSMGGMNIKENLVNLTIREHFIAHFMLAKAFPNHNIISSLTKIGGRYKDKIQVLPLYKISVRLYSEHQRIKLKGNTMRKGKHQSEEAKKLISAKSKLWFSTHKHPNIGKPLTEKQKQNFKKYQQPGENNGRSILKNDDVLKIIKLYFIDKLSQNNISSIIKISRSAIKGIVNGTKWTAFTHFEKTPSKFNRDNAIKLLQEHNII